MLGIRAHADRGRGMTGRKVVVYYTWSHPEEVNAPLGVIEDRYPTLFEGRRILYPALEELSDRARFDQSVAGFLDNILKRNFAAFVEQTSVQTGHPVIEAMRAAADGKHTPIDADFFRRRRHADHPQLQLFSNPSASQRGRSDGGPEFLSNADHVVAVCPHHDIGDVPDVPHDERVKLQ